VKSILLADGRRFAWREGGGGPPLVLLHGWAMSSAVFTEALAEFAGDFRVLVPDLRGHGASDPGEGYLLADLAADLEEWCERLDLRRFSLLGWSLGGQAALVLTRRQRERIARLLLVASTPRFCAGDGWEHGLPDTRVRAMARDLRRSYEPTMDGFFALQFAGEALAPDRQRELAGFAVRDGRLPAPETAIAALETLRREDLRPLLPGIALPVLVQHGTLDRIIPVGAGRFLGAQLPGATCVELSGAGHAPFLSRPQESFRQWREFLR
jgi:pimeloyl-[acyl-carrier protein] methyl ester esterase